MKITIADKFWVVLNPTPLSVIEDICFETDLKGLENQIIGAERGGYRMSNIGMTIHTVELSARQDAEARLVARD
jgi:hypothetical protein